MRVLVVAAHFDDEVIGCGGTVAKHIQNGDEVYVCVLTDSSSTQYKNQPEMIAIKKKESEKVNKILGIKKTFCFDLPDMKLDTVPHVKINECIEKCIIEINPDIIYTHHKDDINKDHKLAFESTLIAGRKTNKIFSYEVPNTLNFFPNIYEDISKTIELKLKAMEAYQSELRKYPHPRSLEAMKIKAQQRGIEIGSEFAEAFVCIKNVRA